MAIIDSQQYLNIECILEGNLLKKSVKRPFFPDTAGELHIFMLYNLLGPETSLI